MALGALRFLSFVAETSFVGAGSGVSPVSRVALRAEEKEGDGKEDTWVLRRWGRMCQNLDPQSLVQPAKPWKKMCQV